MIPPLVPCSMAARAGATVSEVAASHSLYISRPGAVVEVIKQAAG